MAGAAAVQRRSAHLKQELPAQRRDFVGAPGATVAAAATHSALATPGWRRRAGARSVQGPGEQRPCLCARAGQRGAVARQPLRQRRQQLRQRRLRHSAQARERRGGQHAHATTARWPQQQGHTPGASRGDVRHAIRSMHRHSEDNGGRRSARVACDYSAMRRAGFSVGRGALRGGCAALRACARTLNWALQRSRWRCPIQALSSHRSATGLRVYGAHCR